MIIPGSNQPFVIRFCNKTDTPVEALPHLLVTLWQDLHGKKPKLIKHWWKDDMLVTGNVAICPVTELETATMPRTILYFEAKGWDAYGKTILWYEFPIDVVHRRDAEITLSMLEEGLTNA